MSRDRARVKLGRESLQLSFDPQQLGVAPGRLEQLLRPLEIRPCLVRLTQALLEHAVLVEYLGLNEGRGMQLPRQLHRLLEEHEARLFLLQATQAPEHRVNLHQPDRETRGNGELLSAADLLLSLQQLPGIHLLLRQIEADRHLQPPAALTPTQPPQSLPVPGCGGPPTAPPPVPPAPP